LKIDRRGFFFPCNGEHLLDGFLGGENAEMSKIRSRVVLGGLYEFGEVDVRGELLGLEQNPEDSYTCRCRDQISVREGS
jgi:hypothetical protein